MGYVDVQYAINLSHPVLINGSGKTLVDKLSIKLDLNIDETKNKHLQFVLTL